MSAESYPDTMAADTAAQAKTRPNLRAKLTRRLTRNEYAVQIGATLMLFPIRGFAGSAAAWTYAGALTTVLIAWRLARPVPASIADAPRCRWCGLRPTAVLCGGRSDGGRCEATPAEATAAA